MAGMADSPALLLGGTWNAWGLLSRDHQQCVLVPTELLPEGWLWVWASVSGSSSNTTSNFRCASASRRLSLSQQSLGLSPKVTPGRKEAQFHRATLNSSYLIRHWTEMWPCFVYLAEMKWLIPLLLNSLHHSVVRDQPHHMTWTLVRNAQLHTPSQTPWIRNSGVGPSRPHFNKLSGWFWDLWKTWRTTGLWHPCQMVAWLTSAWPLVMENSLPLIVFLNTSCPNQIPCHFSFISSNSTSHFEVKFAQLWPTLCDPHGLYSPGNSPGQNTGMGSLSLLQGIFPTQGSNPGLPHCRRILYRLSHQESPRILEWVAYPFSSGSSQPRNRTSVSCIIGGFFINWAVREAHQSLWGVNSK